MTRAIRLAVAVLLAATALGACGNDGAENGRYDVTTTVVSSRATQNVQVFAPKADGQWPVVIAMHAVGGTAQDMAEIATRLAREGVVVFAPTYRTDLSTRKGVENAATDLECGYRLVRSIAADYGGDLDQPVAFVGWSLGASAALAIGLTEDIDPTDGHLPCPGNVPRPNVIVAISGCHFEYQGVRRNFLDVTGWGNKEADLTLIAGEKDTTCAAEQSDEAAVQLRSAGYDVQLLTLEGANHYAPVFHNLVDGQLRVITDDPPGEQTVKTILEAIGVRQGRA
jgi:dienelactone hydrolase